MVVQCTHAHRVVSNDPDRNGCLYCDHAEPHEEEELMGGDMCSNVKGGCKMTKECICKPVISNGFTE